MPGVGCSGGKLSRSSAVITGKHPRGNPAPVSRAGRDEKDMRTIDITSIPFMNAREWESNFLAAIKSRESCLDCARARQHAARHGQYPEAVSCKSHRFIDKLENRFNVVNAGSNPANTIGVFSGAVSPAVKSGDLVEIPYNVDGWEIINSPTMAIVMGLGRGSDRATIFVAMVAAVEEGEYVARHVAVLVYHHIEDTWTILHDREALIAASAATLLATPITSSFFSGAVVDTCIYGDAVESTSAPVHVQRTSCPGCR